MQRTIEAIMLSLMRAVTPQHCSLRAELRTISRHRSPLR
jgi:hypothetical protein